MTFHLTTTTFYVAVPGSHSLALSLRPETWYLRRETCNRKFGLMMPLL